MGGRLGRLLLEHGVPLTGFVDIDPRKIGGTRHGLPILDGRGECGESLEEAFILAAVGGEGGRVLEQELRRRALNWLPAAGP